MRLTSENIMSFYDEINNNLESLEEKLDSLEQDDIYKLIIVDINHNSSFNLTKQIINKNLFDINFSSKKHLNIILYSILENHPDFFKYLLEMKLVDYNICDENGSNLLHYSAKKEVFFELLLTYNEKSLVELNNSNKNGLKPISIALKNKNIYALDLLLKLNRELPVSNLIDLYLTACSYLDIENFKKLISMLEDNFNWNFYNILNSVNTFGENGLFIALNNKNYELAFFLLKKGIDINQTSVFGNILETSIFDCKSVNLLLNNGYDVNKKNKNNDHPLIFLIKSKNIDIQLKRKIIDLLIKKQLNINTLDFNNNNFLHYCILFKESTSLIESINKKGIIDNQNNDDINSEDLLLNDIKKQEYIKKFNSKYDSYLKEDNFDIIFNFKK